MASEHLFSVRTLSRPDEFQAVMNLQRLIYGEDPVNHIARHSLVSYARNGGQVLGAFEDELLVGFLVSFLGTDILDPRRPAMANLKLIIERLAVHPDYRGIGLATQLARQQREMAVMQGIRLATIAFDPLSSRDAYLYIRKLGGMVQTLVPNYFGDSETETPVTLSPDRVVSEWWLTRNRVEERLFGTRNSLSLKHYLEAGTPIINPSQPGPEIFCPRPPTGSIQLEEGIMLLVEIPSDCSAILHGDPQLAAAWAEHSREVFSTVFQAGYVATDLMREEYEGRERTFYLMSYDGPRFSIEIE
jgi:predicted GNAT superfamily acetyltransferase